MNNVLLYIIDTSRYKQVSFHWQNEGSRQQRHYTENVVTDRCQYSQVALYIICRQPQKNMTTSK